MIASHDSLMDSICVLGSFTRSSQRKFSQIGLELVYLIAYIFANGASRELSQCARLRELQVEATSDAGFPLAGDS